MQWCKNGVISWIAMMDISMEIGHISITLLRSCDGYWLIQQLGYTQETGHIHNPCI